MWEVLIGWYQEVRAIVVRESRLPFDPNSRAGLPHHKIRELGVFEPVHSLPGRIDLISLAHESSCSSDWDDRNRTLLDPSIWRTLFPQNPRNRLKMRSSDKNSPTTPFYVF